MDTPKGLSLMTTVSQILQVSAEFPWDSIRDCHGPCPDLTPVFRELAEGSPQEAESAYWDLDNHIVVQGYLSEAAFYAAPFVVALVQAASDANKPLIYELLTEISMGNCAGIVKYFPQADPFFHLVNATTGIEVPIPIGCRATIALGISSYLSDAVSNVRPLNQAALGILECFDEYGGFLYHKLFDIAKHVTNHILKSDIERVAYSLRERS